MIDRSHGHNAWALGSGCVWLVFGLLLFGLAIAIAGVSINAFPVVLPWIAIATFVGLWLVVRSTSVAAMVLSVLLSLGSTAIAVIPLLKGTEFVGTMVLIAIAAITPGLLAVAGLWQALRTARR